MTEGRSRRGLLAAAVVLASAWRPTARNLFALVRSVVTLFIAFALTFRIFPSLTPGGLLAVPGLIITVFLVSLLLRPVLLGLAVLFGPFGLLLSGIVSQAVILDVALSVGPGVRGGSFLEVLVASWVAAGASAVVNWLFDAGSEDAFLGHVLGRAIRVSKRHESEGPRPGMLIVQLDGLAEPLLQEALRAGDVPTMARWLRDGTHRLRPWHTGLPATTPAGQAVLLHGDVTQVPSFRWYEKETGRIVVANRPKDAAMIEARMSTGRGLLADGGVSISNLFSGDAATALLTMSDDLVPPRSTRGLASFATARGGLPRSLVVFIGEMVAELQQGRRQRRRDVRPRVRRGGVFALVRAVTTVLLRDFTVTLVAEQMARGAPVVFVDFVDYDELAHHAGPSRPEAMRTLDGLDRVLLLFERVAREVGRDFEIVVLSDHGQAQGATFRQQAGRSLQELVTELATVAPKPAEHRENTDSSPAERFSPLNLLLHRAVRSPDPDRPHVMGLEGGDLPVLDPVVAAAGSLAHVYLPDLPGRAYLEDVVERHPRLVAGLAGHPQVGLVLARSRNGGLHAVGASGWRCVTPDGVEGGTGEDPVAAYGPRAAADLAGLDRRAHVGDLVVLGAVNPRNGEVTAFEELVGSHGGLGGAQTQALLLHPSSWPAPSAAELDGPAVHRLLLDRLTALGLRSESVREKVTS